VRQRAPGFFYQLLKGNIGVGKPALQGARAHGEFTGDLLERRAFPRHRVLEGVFDLFTYAGFGVPFLEFSFQLGSDCFEQLFVLGDERAVEVRFAEDESVQGRC